MELSQQQHLPVSQSAAWDALNDTELLKACIPGCESLAANGEDEYEVAMVAAVGPVRARFKGRLRIADKSAPESYRLYFEGQGGPAGFGKGHADVRLELLDGTATLLHYTAHASVGGKLAQIGSRLLDMAAQKMAGEFFSRFTAELQARHPAPSEPPGEAETLTNAASASADAEPVPWTRRLFRKGEG